jgi:enoyl-CoA hydratase
LSHTDLSSAVLLTLRSNIAEIRLNRPQRLNAVIEALYQKIIAAIDQAEQDSSIRVIVLTGEGRAFCVGADMKEHGEARRSNSEKRKYLKLGNEICRRIFQSPKPVIAAINGYAVGAGAEMAIAADFILMKETAQLWLPEVTIGTFFGGGVSEILPRLVGLAKAREIIFTGCRIDGNEALAIGLATRVFSDKEFSAGVEAFSQMLAKKAPLSMRFAKQQLNGSDNKMKTVLDAELKALTRCMATDDWQEGVTAFAEKRKPVFKGR